MRIAGWYNLDPKVPTNVFYQRAVQRENEVRQKYNVKFWFITVSAESLKDEIISSVLAGDPIAEIVRCRWAWVIPDLARRGIIEPADYYFNVCDPLWNPLIIERSRFNGQAIGVSHEPHGDFMVLFYNKSLMERLGLPDPQVFVDKKQWTWDRFEEYCMRIVQDTDNDGQPDIFGSTLPPWQPVVASNGVAIVSGFGGVDLFTLNTPQAIKAFKWLQKLVKFRICEGDTADFAAGKAGFLWGNASDTGFSREMGDKWGVLPVPMGPDAEDYVAWWDEVQFMCIPSGTKEPEKTAMIWTELCRWYPNVSGRADYYRKILENRLPDARDVNMAVFLSERLMLDKYPVYEELQKIFYPDNGPNINEIIYGNTGQTIEQFLNDNSDRIQKNINELRRAPDFRIALNK